MKPLLLLAMVIASSLRAEAQIASPPPLMRGDVAGTVGWLNGDTGRDLTSGDWYNRGLYLGGHAGWYWTEHHKTEIEAGLTNHIDLRAYETVAIDGFTAWSSSVITYALRRVAIGEHYQFGHNALLHPHLGAGLDLTWERIVERADPLIAFGPETRQLLPARTIGATTTLRARPYIEAGFKAYTSPRVFFRGDARVLLRGGFDEVLLRCGFGVDF